MILFKFIRIFFRLSEVLKKISKKYFNYQNLIKRFPIIDLFVLYKEGYYHFQNKRSRTYIFNLPINILAVHLRDMLNIRSEINSK